MRAVRALAAPVVEVFRGLELCLEAGGRAFASTMLGLLVGWFVYVPVHELLHAFACLATGGEVTRLEIDTLYGGALLARVIPFVTAGSDYAGRLSGFSTRGSDLVYLATDLGPFLLTLWPGVWLARRAARAGWSALWGASLPFALAPFMSLTGDAYEIGSILVTRVPPWSAGSRPELLRGDDVFLLPQRLLEAGAEPFEWLGIVLAAVLGVIWAFAWWHLAGRLARALGQAPLELPAQSGSAGTPD